MVMIFVAKKSEAENVKKEEENFHPIIHERIVLVEGKTELFEAILKEHNISDRMQIIEVGGWSKFDVALRRCAQSEKCRSVLVFADNDEDPETRLKEIVSQFNNKNNLKGFHLPIQPQSPVQQDAFNTLIYVDIFMIPATNQKGAIENICWPAFVEHYPEKINCIQELVTCAKIDETFQEYNHFVVRVEALLAILTDKNPKRSLSEFAKETKSQPKDFFSHPTFAPLRDYLIQFSKV
jgi:5S rRNA maturation endonuclease (ribonuclease M5)